MTRQSAKGGVQRGNRDAELRVLALQLLGRWTRITQGHLSLGAGCSCGANDTVLLSASDLEPDLVRFLQARFGSEESLAGLFVAAPALRMDQLLGALARLPRVPRAAAALLDQIGSSLESFERLHGSPPTSSMPLGSLCVALIAVSLTLGLTLSAWAGTAVVSNEGSGTLSLIDTRSDEVVGEINAGGKPRGAALSTTTQRIYVSEQNSNGLLIVDLTSRSVVRKIDLGESPEGVYISSDGAWISAAVELANEVVFVDTARGELAFRVKISAQNPEHAVFSPDGRFVYVSAEEDDKVEVIDFVSRKVIAQITVGERPRGIAFTPDGAKAYVACERADTVYVLDARTHRVIDRIKAGVRSNGVVMSPDGHRLYVSNGGEASVNVIDTTRDQVIATVPVGERPWNMSLTRDGGKLYVANGRSGTVTVIDTARAIALKTIPVGKLPWGVRVMD